MYIHIDLYTIYICIDICIIMFLHVLDMCAIPDTARMRGPSLQSPCFVHGCGAPLGPTGHSQHHETRNP